MLPERHVVIQNTTVLQVDNPADVLSLQGALRNMNSFKKKEKKYKKKHEKKHKKDKKKRRSSSSSSSSSSTDSSSDSSSDEKHKRKKHKKDHKKKRTKEIVQLKDIGESSQAVTSMPEEDFSIPIGLMDNKHKAPETREAYEKRQSVIRRVVDHESGRTRLIKGDGEILEEIVTRDRHHEINKLATQTDGQVYQNKTIGWAVTSDKK